MAKILGALSIEGSGTSLKAIDGDDVLNNDICIVVSVNGLYVYKLTAPNSSIEDIPSIVKPTSNAGDKRWILKSQVYFSQNVEFDKDKHLKIHKIKEKDTDGISFLLSSDDEIMKIDENGLTLNESLLLTTNNLNVGSINNIDINQYVRADGSVSFTDQVKGIYPISDTDLSTKKYVDDSVNVITQATGVSIDYTKPKSYNTDLSPGTGNITDDTTNAVFGITQKIYHEDSSEPTVPAHWVLLNGAYSTGETNIIFAEYVRDDRVEYWIIQEV